MARPLPVFVVLTALAAGWAGCTAIGRPPPPVEEPAMRAEAVSVDDPDPGRFAAEIEAFERWDSKNAIPAEPVLFVGSSSIRMWPTAERFPDLPVVNRGFGGSHISDVNALLNQVVLRYAPRAVVFYAGDNDIASGKSPARVRDDYVAFVEAVHARFPEADIIYLPIKPSLARWDRWPEMKEANALVRTYSDSDPDLHYADLATPMLGEDGRPRPGLFIEDGLHLSPEGYTVWTTHLRPVLDQALGR